MLKKITVCLLAFIMVFTMIPAVALADTSAEISDEFKVILNEDGKLVLDCAPPNNDDEAIFMICEPFVEDNEYLFNINYETFNDDYTTVVVDYYGNGAFEEITESHTVNIEYNYDADIDAKTNSFCDKLSEKYNVTDLEIINYLVNQGTKDGLIYYSGEFKECFDYTNISFDISERAGDDFPLLIRRKGVGIVSYEGVSYATANDMEAAGQFVLYVPDETENNINALLEAAQKRVNEYLGNDQLIKLSYAGKLNDIWTDGLYDSLYHDTNEAESGQSYDEWFNQYVVPDKDNYLNDVVTELGIDKDIDTYAAEVKGKTYQFLILRDSSKMLNPEYKGKHAEIDVEISSNDASVPLDSFVEAEIVDSGVEYDRIHKVLDVDTSKSYDLGLYSGSLKRNITKLDNGKFQVKIPVPAELKGKSLIVYYVDANNKVTPYDVTPEGEYAVFETDHFSIYTLAEKTDTTVPVTGDNNMILLWGSLVFAAITGGLAIRRKRVNA